MSKKLIAINNMKKLTPWVKNLDEVGSPVLREAEELDARLVKLRDEHTRLVNAREEFERNVVRELWSAREVKAAKLGAMNV